MHGRRKRGQGAYFISPQCSELYALFFLYVSVIQKYFAHHPNCPPPLPNRFIRPCDVIGAFSGGHKAIFRLDAPSSNRRRKTRRVWFRIRLSRSEHSNQMRHMFRGVSICDAAGVMLARPTWLINVKSNHYGRCYPIRVNIRKGIVPVLIRS